MYYRTQFESAADICQGVVMTQLIEIACDESGSEGENLMEAAHCVFSHASVNLSVGEAEAIMSDLACRTKSNARELKSKVLLKRANQRHLIELLRPDGPLAGRANIYLADKSYFVVGKIVSLLIEEDAHARGLNITAHEREIANQLFDLGPRALGEVNWKRLLIGFNNLVRTKKRSDSMHVRFSDFVALLDDIRLRSHRAPVSEILALMWNAREHARQFEDPPESLLRQLEPIVPTMNWVATSWRLRLGDVPIAFIHDEHWALNPETTELLIDVAKARTIIGGVVMPAVDLRSITLVDSKSDPRVQVADILAATGRIVGENALQGDTSGPLVDSVKPFLDFHGLWSEKSPLGSLIPPEATAHLSRESVV